MRRILSYSILCVAMMTLSAKVMAYGYDFMFEGVAYKITSTDWNTVELVTGNYSKPDKSYPEVEYNGKSYRVTSIGKDAFQGFKNLKAYTITKWVTKIGDFAFSGCSNLSSLIFDEGSNLKLIGNNSFNYCTSLTHIDFPDGLEEIGYAAFAHCGFSEITFPESLKILGDYSFSSCPSLSWAPISGNVEHVGLSPFFDDPEMKYISHNINNPYYDTLRDGSLFDRRTKTLVEYPCGADNTSYVIPDEVEIIASAAFYGCGRLESVTLPHTIKQIGNNLTFYWMDSLKEVITFTKEPLTSSIFGNAKDIKLIVPFGMTENYGSGWGEIIEMEPLTLSVIIDGKECISQIVDFNQSLTFVIGKEGNSYYSLSFNGDEVTDRVTDKNIYTTPPITKPSTLNLVTGATASKGDINEDGKVDVGDILSLIKIIESR